MIFFFQAIELLSPTESEKLVQINFKKNPSTINDEIDSHMLIQNKNSGVKIWLADLTHTNSRIISNQSSNRYISGGTIRNHEK